MFKILTGLVALCMVATVQAVPTPLILAHAQQTPDGIRIEWTSPVAVDSFGITRSHNGGQFVAITTLAGSASAYLDPTGGSGDVYIVTGYVGDRDVFSSPPTVPVPGMGCDLLVIDSGFPTGWIKLSCLPICLPPPCIDVSP